MSLANDYFLLYHGLPISKELPLEIDEKIDDESFFELSALLLSADRNNFERFIVLETFHHLSQNLTTQPIQNLDALYHLQYSIIAHFLKHRSKSNIKHIHAAFNYLFKEGVLGKQAQEKLISLFDPNLFKEELQPVTVHIQNETFWQNKQSLIVAVNELKTVCLTQDLLDAIIDYLNSQTFSIGVTGVMNAGKSTMLNALMGQEILGTSVVPETANLSIIKYSPKPFAKVVYWDQAQWRRIEKSAAAIPAMQTFVHETKKHFKEDLEDFICPTSREDLIDIDKLHHYTSAKSSDKRANLVKYVEIGSALHFLRDGIEIVDTPGLDDIVIQREEITKEYLAKCDLMLHLMNVSQSATQKDIEFIIDAVLYQNITKILIVITHADRVSAQEVEEVITYTRHSIAAQLHEQNSDSRLDFIMQNLHFIALSAKMALLHRTGRAQEALDAGYSLEQSGISEVEDYLNQTLFGKSSQRSELIIRSAKKRLSTLIDSSIERFKHELSLLSKSHLELEEELASIHTQKLKLTQCLHNLQEQIAVYESEAFAYIQTLNTFLKNELIKLQATIKKRLLDETRFVLENSKKAPQANRIETIINTAIKHGLVDMIRDYRYKFIKKSTQIREAISHQYSDISATQILEDDYSHPDALFGDAFKQGFVTANHTSLHRSVSKILTPASKSKLTDIGNSLGQILKEEFIDIETLVSKKASQLSHVLLKEFFAQLKSPIYALQDKLQTDEDLLQHHLSFIKEDETTRHAKSIELLERIKKIELIAKRCSV